MSNITKKVRCTAWSGDCDCDRCFKRYTTLHSFIHLAGDEYLMVYEVEIADERPVVFAAKPSRTLELNMQIDREVYSVTCSFCNANNWVEMSTQEAVNEEAMKCWKCEKKSWLIDDPADRLDEEAAIDDVDYVDGLKEIGKNQKISDREQILEEAAQKCDYIANLYGPYEGRMAAKCAKEIRAMLSGNNKRSDS